MDFTNLVEKSIAVYAYGSQVYGNAQPYSDYDYVGIQKGLSKSTLTQGTIALGKVNIKLMAPEHFQRLLSEHRMTALECYFLPLRHIIKAHKRPWRVKQAHQKAYGVEGDGWE